MEERTLRAHNSGIDAIRLIASRFEDQDWDAQSGCEGWSARDLAGHLVAVANLWHEILDRAEAGDSSLIFPFEDFAEWNTSSLAALPDESGQERIARYAERASAFVDRVRDHEDLLVGAPPASVSAVPMTLDLFTRFNPSEWHLHALDLAVAIGGTYRAEDGAWLFEGWRELLGLDPLRGDGWTAVVRLSGRRLPAES